MFGMVPDKFCRHCGQRHVEFESPQQCPSCKEMTWHSPKPVAVMLQPVLRDLGHGDGPVGILVGKRGIWPKLGEWNLIGGYVDPTDTSIEMAAARELFEETGVSVSATEVTMKHSFGDGKCSLVFCVSDKIAYLDEVMEQFVPNHECPEIRVAWEPEELCFPSHTRALKRWFDGY